MKKGVGMGGRSNFKINGGERESENRESVINIF